MISVSEMWNLEHQFSWWPRIDTDRCFDCNNCHQLCHWDCRVEGLVGGWLEKLFCSEKCKSEREEFTRPKPKQMSLDLVGVL